MTSFSQNVKRVSQGMAWSKELFFHFFRIFATFSPHLIFRGVFLIQIQCFRDLETYLNIFSFCWEFVNECECLRALKFYQITVGDGVLLLVIWTQKGDAQQSFRDLKKIKLTVS